MKLSSPATQRNKEPIAAVLAGVLPPRGLVLEVASGAGEHAAFFAERWPALIWQPSDPSAEALASIETYVADAGLANLREPVTLDAAGGIWPLDRADAMLCINMVHISSWAATLGLLRGAGRVLPEGGPLILYGPYRRAGVATAASNEAFDQSLKARDPEWGLRALEDVVAEAAKAGLTLDRVVAMPANNLTVIFRKGSAAG